MQTLRLALFLALVSFPATAQDHSAHSAHPAADTTASQLPEVCLVDAASAHQVTPMGAMGGDAAHQELMAGMDRMNTDMMAGATAADIDVAFICGMIPHHQGAIDMAKAQLAHGDDPWARELAERIIAAQEQELAEMKDWLAKLPR